MLTRQLLLLIAIALTALLAVSCGDEDARPDSTPDAATISVPASSPSSGGVTTPEEATPVTASAPEPEFDGYALDLSEGDFWEYRWSWVDGSCFQFRCSSDDDEGVFQVTLGSQREIEGVSLYELDITGKAAVSITGENRDFGPRWSYLGVDGDRIVISNGGSLTTLFDAASGKWAGSGYLTTRFNSNELVTAQTGSLFGGMEIADWPGVAQGPWEFVDRSDSQSACEIIAGERICPNEDTFSFTENEFYRPGIGPVAYQFQNTVTFDGLTDTF